MKRMLCALGLFLSLGSAAQTSDFLSTYFTVGANGTLYDQTRSNNAGGPGLGLQLIAGGTSPLKATFELNGDLFTGTKELRLGPDDRPLASKSGVLGIYAGPLLQCGPDFFLSASAGASVFNRQAHLGFRPAAGVLFSKQKRFMAKASFTHVFLPVDLTNKDFGYASIALGVRLF